MLLHFILVLLVAFLLTGVIRHYALAHKVLDIPNQRSSHTVPTPRGGGLAIVLAFIFGLFWFKLSQPVDYSMFAIMGAALSVAIVGFCDDHAHVPARWRFLIHALASISIVVLLGQLPLLLLSFPFDRLLHRELVDLHWLGYPLAVFFLVWCLNLFNFMDGTDGIAASESLFVSSALAGYVYYLDQTLFYIGMSLAAASFGFLVLNWPKARIFMGDVGSGFLGLMLGVLILMSAQHVAVLLYCGLILFGIFLVDASYTLLVRVFTGQKWYDAHCSHTYQHAAKQYGHLRVLLVCWLINLCWLLPLSYGVFLQPKYALLGLVLAYLPLIYMAYHFKAGKVDALQS